MPTGDPRELAALLLAYIDGDVVARKVVLDWLEEYDDPRRAAVQAEDIDWYAVAYRITGAEKPRRNRWGYASHDRATNYVRYQIDCARVGAAGVNDEIRQAVREARRDWLAGLFPEIELEP